MHLDETDIDQLMTRARSIVSGINRSANAMIEIGFCYCHVTGVIPASFWSSLSGAPVFDVAFDCEPRPIIMPPWDIDDCPRPQPGTRAIIMPPSTEGRELFDNESAE